MTGPDDVPAVAVDVPPRRRRLSLGFNPMEWTVGAALVVLALVFANAALIGAVVALARR